jgi:predicted chitinase
MRLRKQTLVDLGASDARATKYLPRFNDALPKHDIDSDLRVAHFLAQVLHESGRLRFVVENLNYSEEALLRVFGKYFTPARAREYARNPKRIGSRVYGGRMGNGNEASGDGYRYRGRGLIQLTGKNNYRAFSRWLGVDVVAQPDLVAEKYAVHSAAFFWDANRLNDLADADDVKRLTKRINGGYNGLDDRVELLAKAKSLLDVAATLDHATHTVTANMLNLRSRPWGTRVGAIPQGTEVLKLEDSDVAGWARVRVLLNGQIIEGYVATEYLKKIPAAAPPPEPPPPPPVTVPAAHLSTNNRSVTRARDGGRAHPLGEPGRPRRTGTTVGTRRRQLIEIVGYLDPEDPTHLRYRPRGRTTFCNIYAHDYCTLADRYLPRVWWTDDSLQRIRNGETVPAKYDNTVRELNANALLDWLRDHGAAFGWSAAPDESVLQSAANNGEVCLIVAKRRDLNRSGHVAAVVPETDDVQAARDGSGAVLRPVESQAGTRNHRLVVKPTRWWSGDTYQSFGFWRGA